MLVSKKNRPLADVYEAYTEAEEFRQKQKKTLTMSGLTQLKNPSDLKAQDTSVAAYAARGTDTGSAASSINLDSLPQAPANWNGTNCWRHPLATNHKAEDCEV